MHSIVLFTDNIIKNFKHVLEPTLLAKIEKTVTSDSLHDVVLERSLICLKEDWMMSVHSLYLI